MGFLLQGKALFTPTFLQKHLDLCLIVNTTLDFTFPHSSFLLGVMFTFPASRSSENILFYFGSLYLSISGAKGQDFQSPTSMPVACFFPITSKEPQEISHDEVTRFCPTILQVSCSASSSLAQFHKTYTYLQLFLEKTHTYICIYRYNHKHCLIKTVVWPKTVTVPYGQDVVCPLLKGRSLWENWSSLLIRLVCLFLPF